MHGDTIVGTSLIATLKSTKNQDGRREPEMHQTKKCNEWHLTMKVHVGVDVARGYVHTIISTSANMHEVSENANSIRKNEEVVYGDYLELLSNPQLRMMRRKRKMNFV